MLVDNGRSAMLGTEFQEMLRCIRCAACMNHCPVYGAVGGHAYGWVYPGPMGSVLTPALIGVDKAGHLPNASTFCGKCESVCPVKIPLPKLMRHWREREFERHLTPAAYAQQSRPLGLVRTPARRCIAWRRGRPPATLGLLGPASAAASRSLPMARRLDRRDAICRRRRASTFFSPLRPGAAGAAGVMTTDAQLGARRGHHGSRCCGAIAAVAAGPLSQEQAAALTRAARERIRAT